MHEIAHLLVGPNHRHDAVWKAKCIEIGAVAEATIKPYDEARKLPVPSKYTYRCPNCGKLVHTNYNKRLQACYECCHKYNNGKWTPKYIVELIEGDK